MAGPPDLHPRSQYPSAAGSQESAAQALLACAAERLRSSLDQVAELLVARLREEVPDYADPGRAPGLLESARAGLDAALGLLAARQPNEATARYSREVGRLRARQGFPAESLAHGYRIAGGVIWQAVVDTVTTHTPDQIPLLVHAATTVWEQLYRGSRLAADAYRQAVHGLADEHGRRARALLDAFLDGRTEPGDAVGLAAELGVPDMGRFAVALLRYARSRVSPVSRTGFPELPGIRVLRTRRGSDEILVAYLAHRPLAELTAALGGLPGARVGISFEVGSLSEVPHAARLAELALHTCTMDGETAELGKRLPSALLVSRPDLAGALAHQVLSPLTGLEPAERDLLLHTLSVWVDCGGSATQAASRLFCHTNTVRNRLRRLEQLTGHSLAHPREAVHLVLALDAWRIARSGTGLCRCGHQQAPPGPVCPSTGIGQPPRSASAEVVTCAGPRVNTPP
ncbi:helix-turn-helix domain-containing protein [Streptomyces sp. NBC_00656]|uniref:PucR family transcriptional regulator n=1 Tax=Streptomyces sp. NBC_00656 TaxID=2903668 RepID=UPI003252A6D0